MKMHVVVSIAGLERELAEKKTKYAKDKYCFDLFGVSYGELSIELWNMKNKGMDVIPGEGCEHLPDGRCPGHNE